MARLPFTHGQTRNQSEGNNRAIAVVRYSNKSHHFDHPKISSGCGPAHGCQVSPSSSTLRFHIPLFRCLMIAKYIIYLRMADGEDCVKFCEGIRLLDNGFTILLIFFGHFMSVTAQIMPLYKNLRCLVSNVLGNKDRVPTQFSKPKSMTFHDFSMTFSMTFVTLFPCVFK